MSEPTLPSRPEPLLSLALVAPGPSLRFHCPTVTDAADAGVISASTVPTASPTTPTTRPIGRIAIPSSAGARSRHPTARAASRTPVGRARGAVVAEGRQEND